MLPDPCQPHNKGLEATLTPKWGDFVEGLLGCVNRPGF